MRRQEAHARAAAPRGVRTTKQRFEDIDHVRESADLVEGDPRSFARWAKRVGGEYDEELGTNDREPAERTEAGDDVFERIDADYTFQHKVKERLSDLERAPDAPVDSGAHHHNHSH